MLCNLLDEVHRHTFVLVTPDQAEEVLAEHLKDHADMDAVGAAMAKMIEELDDMPTPWVTRRRLRGNDALQQLYFVERRLGVAGRRLDDLEGNMSVEPAGRRVVSAVFRLRRRLRRRPQRWCSMAQAGTFRTGRCRLTLCLSQARRWRSAPNRVS